MTKVIRGYIKTNMVGSKVKFELEFDDEEWDDMSWQEQDEAVFEHAMNHVEWTYEVLEEN